MSEQRTFEQELVEVAYKWKHTWMNQRQNSKEDFENYHRRAFGVDANMIHHLAKMMAEAFNGHADQLQSKLDIYEKALEKCITAFSCIRHNCPVDGLMLAIDISQQIVIKAIDVAEKAARQALEDAKKVDKR